MSVITLFTLTKQQSVVRKTVCNDWKHRFKSCEQTYWKKNSQYCIKFLWLKMNNNFNLILYLKYPTVNRFHVLKCRLDCAWLKITWEVILNIIDAPLHCIPYTLCGHLWQNNIVFVYQLLLVWGNPLWRLVLDQIKKLEMNSDGKRVGSLCFL